MKKERKKEEGEKINEGDEEDTNKGIKEETK
jgi:hypothetical protein